MLGPEVDIGRSQMVNVLKILTNSMPKRPEGCWRGPGGVLEGSWRDPKGPRGVLERSCRGQGVLGRSPGDPGGAAEDHPEPPPRGPHS